MLRAFERFAQSVDTGSSALPMDR